MKRIKKRLPCFLVALCLLMAFMPQTALAAGTGKAMQQISADNPSGGIADGDHIYLGTKDETNYTWTDASPYWRVLDADKMNTGGAGMFVMSESLIGNNPGGIYGNIYFNQDDTKGIAWQGSDARSWCGSFLKCLHVPTNRPFVIDVMVRFFGKNEGYGYKDVESTSGPYDTNIAAARWLRRELAKRNLDPVEESNFVKHNRYPFGITCISDGAPGCANIHTEEP